MITYITVTLSWLKPYFKFAAMFSVYQAKVPLMLLYTSMEQNCKQDNQCSFTNICKQTHEMAQWSWNEILVNSTRPDFSMPCGWPLQPKVAELTLVSTGPVNLNHSQIRLQLTAGTVSLLGSALLGNKNWFQSSWSPATLPSQGLNCLLFVVRHQPNWD